MTDPKIKLQMELEHKFNKNQLLPRIKKEFIECDTFDFTAYMEEKQIPIKFGFDLLAQMALHKRCSLPTLVGILRTHFNDSQVTADMLLRAAEADLVDWESSINMFIVKFTISDDVQAELDKYQFPLPMVVEPRMVRENMDHGYLTSRGSLLLRKNHHEDDICLDHINRVNRIRFSINTEVAHMVKNQWRNLDKPKSGETKADFEKRKRAFDKYDRTAHVIHRIMVEAGNCFHITHKVDKRGRTYSQGYHINPQGNAWCKAVISLYDKELVE